MVDHKNVFLGKSTLNLNTSEVEGAIVTIDNEPFYKISNYLSMPPFFITVVSDSDHWMYVSTHGGLTCGRRNPDSALFPYTTDDKIHDASTNTGPKTIILVSLKERQFLWEPFEPKHKGIYKLEQNIYKSIYGNKLLFEEINYDLKSAFSYCWMNSDKFGFVRESRLVNLDKDSNIEYKIVDGIQNILPFGINRGLQTNMSTLVDGYKKCEIDENTGLGIFTLSAIMSDKAEPCEALKATTVLQLGLSKPKILFTTDQFDKFIFSENVESESILKGRRGSFFVNSKMNLNSNVSKNWYIIAELNQGPTEIILLRQQIKKPELLNLVKQDISKGTENLKIKVAAADGIQYSNQPMLNARHYSNTLFNSMRGGIFSNGYSISKDDLFIFIQKWNKEVFEKNKMFLSSLPEQETHSAILQKIRSANLPDLERLILEYLPLTFSRRHGDPSRPWNQFSIDIKNSDGRENIYYQGNWRDIFQNWNALSLSYPQFIESFITKFVNASTPDGYNPYRITNNGIEWEKTDPDDPWSNIGYWGDHQVIYLLNLLELSIKYHPGVLEELLARKIFVYANVPYKIKPYTNLVNDPRNSVTYDEELEKIIHERVKQNGSDGKLLLGKDGSIYKVNLAEKILVSLLAKISNFVPGGGIWMSTQRPEWNDANNALVGYGLSMVTLYNLYRFINQLKTLFKNTSKQISVSKEVIVLFKSINNTLERNLSILNEKISDEQRKTLMDELGEAGEIYRKAVYSGFSEEQEILETDKFCHFLRLCQLYFHDTIKRNKRPDGLYHSYNLVHFNTSGYAIENLYEMLEGQVAILGSGFLTPEESIKLLDALRQSKLYRSDQKTYMLYPNRELPAFLEKNNIPEEKIRESQFLMNEIKIKSKKFIEVDSENNFHFNGTFQNASELMQALIKEQALEKDEAEKICKIYYDLFNHSQFTGRSGTFFKYEGLGCIYWHMVSKLQLAVQELWFDGLEKKTDKSITDKIYYHYQEIKAGMGGYKSPVEYGAFPTDPYSHTPGFTGAQQPGMTGQVKEDFISRFGELGVIVQNGIISFNPSLLHKDEFLKNPSEFTYYRGKEKEIIKLEKSSLAFLVCGIPVIYVMTGKEGIFVELKNGMYKTFNSNILDKETSQMVFDRNNEIYKIVVNKED